MEKDSPAQEQQPQQKKPKVEQHSLKPEDSVVIFHTPELCNLLVQLCPDETCLALRQLNKQFKEYVDVELEGRIISRQKDYYCHCLKMPSSEGRPMVSLLKGWMRCSTDYESLLEHGLQLFRTETWPYDTGRYEERVKELLRRRSWVDRLDFVDVDGNWVDPDDNTHFENRLQLARSREQNTNIAD